MHQKSPAEVELNDASDPDVKRWKLYLRRLTPLLLRLIHKVLL